MHEITHKILRNNGGILGLNPMIPESELTDRLKIETERTDTVFIHSGLPGGIQLFRVVADQIISNEPERISPPDSLITTHIYPDSTVSEQWISQPQYNNLKYNGQNRAGNPGPLSKFLVPTNSSSRWSDLGTLNAKSFYPVAFINNQDGVAMPFFGLLSGVCNIKQRDQNGNLVDPIEENTFLIPFNDDRDLNPIMREIDQPCVSHMDIVAGFFRRICENSRPSRDHNYHILYPQGVMTIHRFVEGEPYITFEANMHENNLRRNPNIIN